MNPSKRIEPTAYSHASSLALAAMATLVVLTMTTGCSGADEGRGRRLVGPESAEVPRALPPWEHFAALESLERVRSGPSSHFLGRPDAEFRINEAAESYGRRGVLLPSGALIVVSHTLPGGPIHFAMERASASDPTSDPTPGAWDYAVIDAQGTALERGRIPACVRCHEEAASDEVFGASRL